MAEFGGNDPTGTIVARQVVADQPFGKMVAVTLGGIDQIDAGFRGLIEDGIGFGLSVGVAPFTAKLPRA